MPPFPPPSFDVQAAVVVAASTAFAFLSYRSTLAPITAGCYSDARTPSRLCGAFDLIDVLPGEHPLANIWIVTLATYSAS